MLYIGYDGLCCKLLLFCGQSNKFGKCLLICLALGNIYVADIYKLDFPCFPICCSSSSSGVISERALSQHFLTALKHNPRDCYLGVSQGTSNCRITDSTYKINSRALTKMCTLCYKVLGCARQGGTPQLCRKVINMGGVWFRLKKTILQGGLVAYSA